MTKLSEGITHCNLFCRRCSKRYGTMNATHEEEIKGRAKADIVFSRHLSSTLLKRSKGKKTDKWLLGDFHAFHFLSFHTFYSFFAENRTRVHSQLHISTNLSTPKTWRLQLWLLLQGSTHGIPLQYLESFKSQI